MCHQINYRLKRVERIFDQWSSPGCVQEQPDTAAGTPIFDAAETEVASPVGFTAPTPEIGPLDVSRHRLIATGSAHGVVRLWDFASGTVLLTHRFPAERIRVVRFSDDGSCLAVVQTNQLHLIDLSALPRSP